jgi:hypothetical protein
MRSPGERTLASSAAPGNPLGTAMRLGLASLFAGPVALMLMGMSHIARQQQSGREKP